MGSVSKRTAVLPFAPRRSCTLVSAPYGSSTEITYVPPGSVVLFTTNEYGMLALIVASLLICALVSVAPRPATRQSDKNNFVTIFILSTVVYAHALKLAFAVRPIG